MNDTCGHCRFYRAPEAFEKGSAGECRRHPPTVAARPGAIGVSEWPVVEVSDWCGDFARFVRRDGTWIELEDENETASDHRIEKQ